LKKISIAMTNTGTNRKTTTIYLLAILSALVLFTNKSTAQGNLLITPRRVVFEGNKQSQELTLANTGADTARYTVSFVQYRMTEDGSFIQIDQPNEGQFFADKYLRFFPRSVTLPPNGSQVIRMQYRKMPEMQNVEYRSHVYFRAVPTEKLLGDEQASTDTTSIGIKLVPIFGISIPVIIRNGDLQAKVDLTSINLDLKSDTVPNLALTFERSGDKSVYGDLSVSWVLAQAEPVEVGAVRGIAVYTPNSIRNFKMQLRKVPGVDYSKGKLMIRFQAPNDGKAEIYAEKEFLLK
jgi:P pilus assembly chaperone PapD